MTDRCLGMPDVSGDVFCAYKTLCLIKYGQFMLKSHH